MPDSVINIARIADGPATNTLSSGTLRTSIERFAYAALGAQAHALVVSRQPPIPELDNTTRDLSALQAKLREHAAYVTQTLIPGALTGLTDTDAAVNLFTAVLTQVQSILAKGEGARSQAATLVGSVIDDYKTRAANAGETADMWKREAEALAALVGTLEADVNKTIQGLDGPDGVLKTTKADIERTIEQLAADIDATVKSGQQIGEGIKSLITGIVTSISGLLGGGNDDKNKPDPSDEKKDKPDAQAAGADSVSVVGIAAIEQGAEGAGRVRANFLAHYRNLAALYQTLAEAKATLAATRAVQSQAALLARAVKDGADAAASNHNSWTTIAAGFADYARKIAEISPPNTLATLKDANQDWSRLPKLIRELKDAFAGIGNAIPPVGVLTDLKTIISH
jgi:hypothetical protein